MSSAAAKTDDFERRRAPRTKFGKWPVRIKVDGCEPIVACVWDVSPTGTGLLVPADTDLPAVFKIDFDSVPRVAEVRWRRDNFVGVQLHDAIF